jgi:fatty-acyl-CoA synthase
VVGANDMALLPYTSGTTGLPKGCVHHHSSLMHNAVAGPALGLGSTSEAVVLAVVPDVPHHRRGEHDAHGSILAAATLVIMPRWDRDVAGRLISRWKVTSLDQHPDHGDRPDGQPQLSRATTCRA